MIHSPVYHRTLLWLVIIAALSLILTLKLQLSFDLGAFLPRGGGASNEILLQQLGSGPGSRLMVVGIAGGELAQRQEASRSLQAVLSESPEFVQVLNGEAGPGADAVPEPVRSRYPLMLDLDYSTDSLSRALQNRLQDLALAGSTSLVKLVAADPFLASLDLLQQLAPGSGTDATASNSGEVLWVAADGSTVLLAETRAVGTDLKAQAEAMAEVRAAFMDLPEQAGLKLDITGVGPFGVELQQSIQAEAKLRSILASLAVVLVLLVLFRSLRLLLLVALPVVVGLLAGLTAVCLFFDSVHGITLAFGFTLLGVAVDFPIHLFAHQRSNAEKPAWPGFWRTLWLGAISTALAYLAMLFSGAAGLAQLGLFSAAGVLGAMAVTRSWLPLLLPANEDTRQSPSNQQPVQLRMAPALLVLLTLAGFYFWQQQPLHWDDRLASLSPVESERVERDNQLRSASASFDMRYQLRLQAASLEQLLLQCEQLNQHLAEARENGLLAGWSSPCMLLPSEQQQKQRQMRIPAAAELHERVQSALSDSPFRPDALQPFEQISDTAKTGSLLQAADFDEGPLAAWLAAHLLELDGQWFALVNLSQPQPEPLAERVQEWGLSLSWVDLHESSQQMMQAFRMEATRAVIFAVIAILLMLALARTGRRRLLWILLSAAASLSITLAVILLLHGAVNLVHLVSLLLVLGLGLDYSLFLSRADASADLRTARYSIIACALSTTLAFGILSDSSIPMLRFIGLTVAAGSLSAFVLAYLGSSQRKAG